MIDESTSLERDSEKLNKWIVELAHGECTRKLEVSPKTVVELLKQGESAELISEISTAIPFFVIAEALNLHENTLRRKIQNHDRLSAAQYESLLSLSQAWCELRGCFNNQTESVVEWLAVEIERLDGAAPVDLMSTQFGRGVLREVAAEIRNSEFA